MQVAGVRSFGPGGQAIAFHTPLTLIVGYNGSGKTTIIECLKYITTGELPPNSTKGGAFIHDPALENDKEMHAQVKLAFTGTSGVDLVATRRIQLTVKKNTRQQKTLEGSLSTKKSGERTAISSRVAELDQIMPQYLGASKAILEYVIFCHQDESLWPMSEPSALKKRFDEIFEALKYTKAIDNIKQLRKKQNEELGKYKIMEANAKENKERGERLSNKSQKLHQEIEDLREETIKLGEEAQEALDSWSGAARESKNFEKTLGMLEGKRIEAQAKEESIRDLKTHITEMHESDEWLQSTLDQYEERLGTIQTQEREQKDQYVELDRQIETSRKQLGIKQAAKGKVETEKAHYERQVAKRQEVIKGTARRHNIRGFDDTLDENQIDDFMHRIRKMSKEGNMALDKARREAQEQLRTAQNAIDQLEQRKRVLQESKVNARRQIAHNDQEMQSYQKKHDLINVDEGRKATLEGRFADVNQKLVKAKQDAATASWDSKLQDANAQLRTLEDESSRLNSELVQGTKRAGDLARLDHLKQELKDRERSLATLKGVHGDRITAIVGDWELTTLAADFDRVVEDRSREQMTAERERDGISRELEQVQFKLKTARKALENKKTEAEQCSEHIRNVIEDEPSEFPSLLREREFELEESRASYEGNKSMLEYFEKCLDAANKTARCRTCMHEYKDGKELQKFKDRLRKAIAANQQGGDEELKEFEAKVKACREVSTDYDTWQRLTKNEIPSLEKEISSFDAQKDELLVKVEKRDKRASEWSEAKKEAERLGQTVRTIAQHHCDIQSFQNQIQDLATKQQNAGLTRTLEDIQEEIVSTREKASKVKQTVSKLSDERNQAKDDINRLEIELRDVQSDLSNAIHQLENKANLLGRVEEFKALNQKQRQLIDQADNDIDRLVPEISTAQLKYDDAKESGEKDISGLQHNASQLSDSLHQLELASEEIKAYEERGGPTRLAQSQREIKQCENEIGRLREEQTQLTISIKKIQDELTNSENSRRSINDNIRYRRDRKALESVLLEIKTLEEQHADIDVERIQEEVRRMSKRHERLSAERAGKLGQMKSKDDQLKQLLEDWNTDYKDAAYKFKECHIKVETTKAAVEDLGRYGGALDHAIMRYHSLKMEEINRIIEELWQRTYKGTDVDSIVIRSDNESAKGNRSYNYRVCMVKQDVEMDMRGRCSAGQKVLASIIIRLALAECFGVNCGIIALDEPTTNLDRDNIRSLAEALHEIIEYRRKQANFQLIVITHDEEFLKHMQCGDFADYCYRVKRDHDQRSVIDREDIVQALG